MTEPRVKPLEWKADETRPETSWTADTPWGRYRVVQVWWGAMEKWGWACAQLEEQLFHTLESAQAAAQADHEKIIRSALLTDVTGLAEPAAWRWRAELFKDWSLSARRPGNREEMEAATGLNMQGLEVEPLFTAAPATWQTIGNAPIHQSIILCFWWAHAPDQAFRCEGYLDRDERTWRLQNGEKIGSHLTGPTHWTLMPEAPKPEGM